MSYIRENVSERLGDMAAYYFWRRLLFYYIDMKNSKNNEYAKRLVDEIKSDKMEISRVYGTSMVAKGDKARMKLFMVSPFMYSFVVKLYEKFIIPVRQ